MKTKIFNPFTLILTLLFISYSCYEDDLQGIDSINDSSAYTQKDKKENESLMNSINMEIFGTENPTIVYTNGRSVDEVIKDLTGNDTASKIAPLYSITGPYYKTGNRFVNYTNRKILWYGSYPPVGVYFADIYSYPVEISVPTGVTYVLLDENEPANRIGYINYTTQELGIATDLVYSGGGVRTFKCNTMSIKITANLLGQVVPHYAPFSDSSVTYKYYFLTL